MKNRWFISGKWNAVCDVCGFDFKSDQLKKRWDGLMVCNQDWEMRHPQDLIRPLPVEQAPVWTRPTATEDYVNFSNSAPQGCSALGVYANAGYGTAGCMIAGNFLNGLL